MTCEEWPDDEENSLVRAAQAGDVFAFDKLARRYRAPALIVARRALGKAEGADDVVQDAFIAAYKGLPRLSEPGKFAAWLSAIVRNRAKRELTGAKLVTEPLSDHVDRLIAKAIPSLAEPQSVTTCVAEEMFDGFPEETREIANLYYLHELPVGKIAELLGLSRTTVKWRLHTVRTRVRQRHAHTMEKS